MGTKMKTSLGPVVFASVMLLASSAYAQFARQEIIAIQSITISDSDFLQGKADGKPVTIAGRLLLPKATPDAKQPAVILIHGSGGIGGSAAALPGWERELTSAGFAVLTLDSFTARGIVSTVADQSQLGRYNAIVDAYRALDIVAKHRNIDADKIAVMGFSRGGQSSVYSNLERFRKSYGSPDRQFAAHIGVYAGCGWSLKDDDQVMKPMMFLRRMIGSCLLRARNIPSGLRARARTYATWSTRMRTTRMTLLDLKRRS